jgi:hypothetical protein
VKTFNNWLTEQELRQILTYDIYYKSLDNLSVIDEKWINENIITDKIKNIKNLLTGGLNKIFNEIKMFTEKYLKSWILGYQKL